MAVVKNWGYWLSSFDVARVAAAPHDLLVIDSEISANRTFEREFQPDEVARMRRRPDGSSRVLLAYLSIGEAERYRPYWQEQWYDPAHKPAWLHKENRRWAGNYAVQFWDPEWQQLIFGRPESYLDRIMTQGFDGVYLDRADVFFEWRKLQPSARSDMVRFITRLAEHARSKNPEFLVVMQNAEELLEDPPVLEAIDGIAKEDLLYGVRRAHGAQQARRRDLVNRAPANGAAGWAQGAGRGISQGSRENDGGGRANSGRRICAVFRPAATPVPQSAGCSQRIRQLARASLPVSLGINPAQL